RSRGGAGGDRGTDPGPRRRPPWVMRPVREGFRALTTRGRAFLAAGVTAALCAVLLGQDDLLRVAALLAVLPLVAAWLTARRLDRLSLRRQVAPERITVGQEATVTLTVVNGAATAAGSF